jgi:hypothetical protein
MTGIDVLVAPRVVAGNDPGNARRGLPAGAFRVARFAIGEEDLIEIPNWPGRNVGDFAQEVAIGELTRRVESLVARLGSVRRGPCPLNE